MRGRPLLTNLMSGYVSNAAIHHWRKLKLRSKRATLPL
jgi:hypothetical protein